MSSVSEENFDSWRFFGRKLPRAELIYFSQIILIYIVIITCILNLSLQNNDSNLWTALLSSCLGYILPNPRLKREKIAINHIDAGSRSSEKHITADPSHRMLPSEFTEA